ncbi:hypothetical protein K6119_13025 [Paracrocinitomix mangrovi]|uniref:hypothetical protein n=1 Tax=Paracrocinitomix mangrovi TaxID=2862509 RepID=UPI001C8E3026|nr:hypothetical protein [Paracrocinitomix mangrovi]UKN00652.1 hypothetical protein K6119_13025 [Paracrocinitomix mangrovi]
MKKFITTALAMCMVFAAMAGGKETLIEQIKNKGKVNVYIQFAPIAHDPGSATGSTSPCVASKFKETSEFTEEYKAHSQKIVDLLNKQLKLTELALGDLSTIPVKSEMNDMKIYDWAKSGEKFFGLITVSGSYKATASTTTSEIENALWIPSRLMFIEMKDNGGMSFIEQTSLGTAMSEKKMSTGCEKYAYFKENFPINDLLQKFQEGYESKIEDFALKQLKKYDKAQKKKK